MRFISLYSPECLEGVFCEGHIQHPAWITPPDRVPGSSPGTVHTCRYDILRPA